MTLTDEQIDETRKAYLLYMSEQLMTAPIEQLEFMYNETKRRCETQAEAIVYPRLVEVIEWLADTRSMTIVEIDGKFRFTR